MKITLLITLLLYSFQALAVFQKIWKGYQVSSFNQSQHLDHKISKANYLFEKNKYDWTFEVTPTHENSYPDALFDFQSRKTVKNSMAFSLKKPTYKWGTFAFNHTQTVYDLSEWPSNTIADEIVYENRNSFSYSYDFLDRSLDKDYELILLNKEKETAQANLNIEKGYFDFFTVYIQAKLQVFSVELNKEFVKRANKRVKQIQKRVKDGLSRKVELIQAKTSLLQQQESLEKTRSSLKQNLAVLENIIGQEIDESMFKDLRWLNKKFDFWQKYISKSKHYSLAVLEESLKTSEKAIEKIADQTGYKLLLNASYISNDIDPDASESFNNAFQSLRDTKTISLNFVIPLGGDQRRGLRQKYIYQKKKNELDILTKKDELKAKKEALTEQILYLEKATNFAVRKVSLSKQVLSEQNRLYLRGQATFEEVIRAEENYINAELTEKRLLAEYETLIANYAFFNNSIKEILNHYQD